MNYNVFNLKELEGIKSKNTYSPELNLKERLFNKNITEIKTINSGLKGKLHAVTNVEFKETIVRLEDNSLIKGVFPRFESMFDTNLPKEYLKKSDPSQFEFCNKKLHEDFFKGKIDISKFNPDQIEQIKNGDQPRGLIWHHNEKVGKMQLVDAQLHTFTTHTGGRSLWGGGSNNR